jgi:hypothetical protein
VSRDWWRGIGTMPRVYDGRDARPTIFFRALATLPELKEK